MFLLAWDLVLQDFIVQNRLILLHRLHFILRLHAFLKASLSPTGAEIIQLERTVFQCLLEEVLRSNSSNSDGYAQVIRAFACRQVRMPNTFDSTLFQ